ncbi:unnamed protein product [Rotaria magnacalcarata]|uniref:IRS-type PTB domain-containing protein n=1 Tax=Rotaria magnacalcarata TaxID=392030 RepID=A0A816LT02_9BILA|nr:unnamed protein product [Rotaria magnacalcarata]CAF1417705.1 unnamed protein product [Rotaria magnacalcarata]CAF1955547.1 unnamed protein product [Rotaria magnacalcarata]CAF2156776.1 unnamed protein product [Rotaria magnacalcarata]CAF4003495.1 unnamed protein product [Rotaria magnacalcarata]
MGNNNSTNNLPTDLFDTSVAVTDDIFKVDNINSSGRKHASAKIHVSNHSLCIRQKHRQALQIPLETIKRYGLDGSIFILECGRRAPLGPARYAFRCKQAHRLVNCLDQRIAFRSKQLLEQQRRGTMISSSSTLTNVSTTSRHHHPHRRRRTQSDQGVTRRAPSSVIFSSSSSSSISLHSRETFSYRNSEPNLSENYLPFDILPCHRESTSHNEERRQFIARLKQHVERDITPDLNYVELKSESTSNSIIENGLRNDLEIPIATEEPSIELMKESPFQQTCKRALLSFFNPHQQSDSNQINTVNQNNTPLKTNSISKSSSTAPYVYIDHEKTTTLKEIANERLQQQQARRIEV